MRKVILFGSSFTIYQNTDATAFCEKPVTFLFNFIRVNIWKSEVLHYFQQVSRKKYCIKNARQGIGIKMFTWKSFKPMKSVERFIHPHLAVTMWNLSSPSLIERSKQTLQLRHTLNMLSAVGVVLTEVYKWDTREVRSKVRDPFGGGEWVPETGSSKSRYAYTVLIVILINYLFRWTAIRLVVHVLFLLSTGTV